MIKSAVMVKGALNFFKEVDSSEKEPETDKSGGDQKQSHSHGCHFYASDHLTRDNTRHAKRDASFWKNQIQIFM